jgi:cytochrome c553
MRAAGTTVGRLLAYLIAGVAGLAATAFIVAWSGVYNVAASRGHWAIMEWFLAFGMRNSVTVRAMPITPPPLDRADLVTLGAGHFHSGCALCHGAPGIPISPIAHQMLPSPPDLARAVASWSDAQLFWIVKHGIKYTGMPGWVAIERDDEIWAVVAFLKKLPPMTAGQYRELALGSVARLGQSGEELAVVESDPRSTGACARCHGAEGHEPSSSLVPVLHGQSVEFLKSALRAYANGTRRSGIMQPLAVNLDDQDIERLAKYYAALAPPRSSTAGDGSANERGRTLATAGDPANGIPACSVCHGRDALPTYPRLAGQSAVYMAAQLNLWKAGHNTASGGAAIMAPIARRLTPGDIEAVTRYFASLDAEAHRSSQP